MNSQKGFTLIELVIVIVVLGILAAIALPRYLGLQRDARIAQLHSLAAAMKSAAMMVRGKVEIAGIDLNRTNVDVQINYDGIGRIRVDYGYPDEWGIRGALDVGVGNWHITSSGNSVTYQWKGMNNCKVVYTASTAPNVRPTISVTDSGC